MLQSLIILGVATSILSHILFHYVSDAKLTTTTICLSYITEGKTPKFLKYIEATGENDFPTIIETDVTVVISIEIVCEIDAHSSQLVFEVVKGVYHLRYFLVFILGMQFYVKIFVVFTTFPASLDKFYEVINLERCPDVWVSDDDMRSSGEVITEKFFVRHIRLVSTYFNVF